MSFSPGPSGPLGGTSIQEQRDRWERKRSRTAKELVQTEQRYCQQLELVTTYFVEILKAKGTLRQDIRESIFSSIKAIHSVNQSLLVHLENGYFGRGFEQICPHLHHYNTYVDNIYNASKALGIQLRKNKAFRRFKKLQEARPEFSNHKLEDLLQLPVQRIDQYKHFLQDLTANTSPDNPEFQQLSRAVTAICEVSQRIQNNTRRHENHLQLCRVQKLLKGRKTKVSAAGRWYIREGWLKVVPPKGADATPKMFFLFSDMLLQAKRCSPLQFNSKDKFTGQHAFPLQDCTVEKVFGHTRSRGGLLSLTFPKAKLLLMSSNQEDLNDWYQSLSSAIRKLQSKQTVVHHRDDELSRRPLRSATADDHNTPSSGRKRNMVSPETSEQHQKPPAEWEGSAPKRMKQSDAPEQSSADVSTSSCVIL
ncbi:rho guanine nucleotide exchange factor 39 isoform X1 [Sebastes umbrosus]|uniref:rho guanine nucleotide exchange factor 39 isoform X1 n=1 Tax=Sebastes umbrosus TaxID=72105 RepID=UPI00189C73E6|nr:rho guanine nucleotide exchange factor 39 isoform X1 [Sebastes umbrosus]XP_037617125.1 rho guanine nucleotide exchange factor 39 isoform X1 [Sebastes umbrosus]XP_037617126.1 rho guanine nucleotide exchange factor 39 isoform X1 [Sebastes umbrosus]XP_037617127.1 rho guanine nucleotide exchange factor 39 isoform X1 [Sebastes umbrosus]XP_037617129.1 rho guanine nucleotide exchange factor 39 isoform X1 [Sebastes umbrosus]XP_037617130.1 rho guanine nucleotide exchange factor 39 isoform X1 [Sebast